MHRIIPLVLVLAFTLLSKTGVLSAEPESRRPNFVFLLVDDLRWNTLGCMGDRIVQTPNIDRLAQQGLLFENAFVTTSICWVSRASIFSGQWMRRHGIVDANQDFTPEAWADTYPARLQQAGYRTGFSGKFGVGNAKAIAARKESFDFFRGLPGQAGMFFEANDPTRTHKTARFGNDALEFIAGVDPAQPFCLSVSFNAVHARDAQPREFAPDPRDESLYAEVTIPLPELANDEAFQRLPPAVQKSEGRRRWGWRFDTPEKAQRILRDYYRLITGVDREVGRIVAALEKRGLAGNTVIIFMGDNGFALGDRGLADKWFMYEEDIRVSLIMADPRLPADRRGARIKAMALNTDIAPTILDLAGLEKPARMQGRSLAPFLAATEPPDDWRTEFFYEHHSVRDRIPRCEGVRTERWKYIRWIDEEPVLEELYDLVADPLETRNLVSDSNAEAKLAELRTRWERSQAELK